MFSDTLHKMLQCYNGHNARKHCNIIYEISCRLEIFQNYKTSCWICCKLPTFLRKHCNFASWRICRKHGKGPDSLQETFQCCQRSCRKCCNIARQVPGNNVTKIVAANAVHNVATQVVVTRQMTENIALCT